MSGLHVEAGSFRQFASRGNLFETDFGLNSFTVGAIGHEILTGWCYRLVSVVSYHWNISSLRPLGNWLAVKRDQSFHVNGWPL